MRIATVERKTGETQISLTLNLDGTGKCDVKNPIGFFDHMLKSFCKHGLFDLTGSIKGDLEVDQHHLIEDTGIVLGLCFSKALGDCAGIFRSGFFIYPMDETLAQAAVVRFLCAIQNFQEFRLFQLIRMEKNLVFRLTVSKISGKRL